MPRFFRKSLASIMIACFFVMLFALAVPVVKAAVGWVVSGVNIYFTGGNVGIGTTTPSTSLHVNGNGIIGTSSAPNGGNYDLALSPYTSIWAVDNDESYLSHNIYYNTAWKYREAATATNLNLGNGFYVQTAPSGAKNGTISYAGAMNLDANGNFSVNSKQIYAQKSTGKVGIGNTAPTEALDVTGNAKISGALSAIGNILTNGSLTASSLTSNGAITAKGSLTSVGLTSNGNIKVNGNIISDGDICIGKCL